MALWEKEEKLSPLEFGKALMKAELLEEENKNLRAQVDRLQEALVAATAAKAYESMQQVKNDIKTADSPEVLELRKRQREEENIMKSHLENLEKPLFDSGDDLISSLGKVIGYNIGTEESQPGNSES